MRWSAGYFLDLVTTLIGIYHNIQRYRSNDAHYYNLYYTLSVQAQCHDTTWLFHCRAENNKKRSNFKVSFCVRIKLFHTCEIM